MMKNKLVISLCFLATLNVFAQVKNGFTKLNEVNLVIDTYVKNSSIGFKKITLEDSILVKNNESFTSLLRFNTPIYLRENGAGGVSTARFRGTSSSNTAVVWNGININSIQNGLTDFNALTVSLFDNIDVRSGGGSFKYGSGAIGGTIHLNNSLDFKKHQKHQLISTIGSYDTYQNIYKFSFGNTNYAGNFGISTNQSDNAYPLLGTSYKNHNGAYKNLQWNVNFAAKISETSQFKFFTSKYNGTRHFSGELPNPTSAKEKYVDKNQQNLLVFENTSNQFKHVLKAAFLQQDYAYYADKNINNFDYGKTDSYIFNYDLNVKLNALSKIESFTEYKSIFGKTNKITTKNRREFSQSATFTHAVPNRYSYNLNIRKDFNSDYKVPFVLGFGAETILINDLAFRINGSKNYRVPTYNDLYWPGLGNPNLIPENSLQYEVGLVYKSENTKIDLAFFHINSKDQITWTPNGDPGRPGLWTPINLASTENKGLELTLQKSVKIQQHYFQFNSNYAYTLAKDKETNKYLIFVPKHLWNSNVSYQHKKTAVYYQFLVTGKLFTTEDNLAILSAPAFDISNIGIDYKLLQTKTNTFKLGLKINNIYNEIYYTTPRRPLPNRNFNIHINYIF